MNFPSMLELQAVTNAPVDADLTLRAVTLKAIYTSVVSGATITASISGTGPTSDQKNRMFNDLGAAGLAVVNSGSTFTVAWQPQ